MLFSSVNVLTLGEDTLTLNLEMSGLEENKFHNKTAAAIKTIATDEIQNVILRKLLCLILDEILG